MGSLTCLIAAEWLKLRRSAALRTAWLLPTAFLVLELGIFERPYLRLPAWPPGAAQAYASLQLKLLIGLWGGFFQPVLVALLPAFFFLPEHRFKLGRRLYTLPVSKRSIFLAKAFWLLVLSAGSLALLALGLFLIRTLGAQANPLLTQPFPWPTVLKILAWLWLGSLPLLAFYLWTSERIYSLAVPVMLGLIGILLTITLSGQDLRQAWRRDLNPWVLPFAFAQQALPGHGAEQAHTAAKMFQEEPNVLRLPNGKRIRTWQNVPDDVLFPPTPPTPPMVLGTFSLGAAVLILVLGWAGSGKIRT